MGISAAGSKSNGDNRPNQATRIFRSLATDPSRRARLRDNLGVFALRLNDYKNRGLGTATWIKACDDSVKAVEEAISRNELDRGWAFLHEGERLEIDGLDGATLRARATAVRLEAEAKLNGWRKESSVKILDTAAASNSAVEKDDKKRALLEVDLRNELKEALRLRDEHFFNVYRKGALQSELLVLTALILALLLGTLVSFANNNPSEFLGAPDDLLRAMMYGALGALISTAVSLAEDQMSKKRIPEHLATTYATLARPFFGASFGVAAYIAMHSGVVKIFDTPAAIALGCVLAGFSERWFLGIFDSAIAKKGS